MRHIEIDNNTFPADAYRVKGFDGVACYVMGWETEPDEDTEWSGYESRTGRVVIRMVGDDQDFKVDREDISDLGPKEYCRSCGQIGCQCNVHD